MRRSTLQAATIFLLIFNAHAHAQTRAPDAPARAAPQTRTEPSPSADEDYELNIDLRRIHEADFSASTSVSTGGASGLRLNVGVALRASDIDVLLRNVRGRVRFRATLEPVLRLLDLHGDAAPRNTPAATPP